MNTANEVINRKENIKIINEIINSNRVNITKAIVEAQIEHAHYGKFIRVESFAILFDLEDGETYKIVCGQGYSEDLYKKALDGRLINVYSFQSGQLYETAKESVLIDFEDEDIEYDIELFHIEVPKKIEMLANICSEININYDKIPNVDLSYLTNEN